MAIRQRPWLLASLLVLGLALIAVAWWLGSPLFLNRAVDEAFPAASTTVAAGAQEALDARALLVFRGDFVDGDAMHKGAGQAAIYRLPDGKHVLRFDSFEVTNGPDLYVVLSGVARPASSQELHSVGYLELAKLKGNQGSQHYELPADLNVDHVRSVAIYCKAFSVIFSTAILQPGM